MYERQVYSMETKYLVYWNSIDGIKKKITCKEFDSLKAAEEFAKEKLKDCFYSIRKVKEAR